MARLKRPKTVQCAGCGNLVGDYWTVQAFKGEPLYGKMAQIDLPLCLPCKDRKLVPVFTVP